MLSIVKKLNQLINVGKSIIFFFTDYEVFVLIYPFKDGVDG